MRGGAHRRAEHRLLPDQRAGAPGDLMLGGLIERALCLCAGAAERDGGQGRRCADRSLADDAADGLANRHRSLLSLDFFGLVHSPYKKRRSPLARTSRRIASDSRCTFVTLAAVRWPSLRNPSASGRVRRAFAEAMIACVCSW